MEGAPDARATDPTGCPEYVATASPALADTIASAGAPEVPGTGERIGRYEVSGVLGAGGMGVVLAARDPELDRAVAIKLLKQGAGNQGRLLREAQAAARLSHRNVVAVFDVGTVEHGSSAGQVFVAMELVVGEDLGRWQATPRPWRDAVAVYLQAAHGLSAAHRAGLVHRDFKPDNAMLGHDGVVRVTDFGLASVAGTPELAATPTSSARLSLAHARLTSTGDVMGTPLYMAPEQRAGRAVDARADQYAFCVALFRAVYGVYPFGADDEPSLVRRAGSLELAAPAAGRQAPRALRQIIARGLAPDPTRRFASMAALIESLERVLGARRRRRIAAVVTVGMLGAAATAVVAMRDSPSAAACSTDDDAIAEVWNASAREQLAAIATPAVDGVDAWVARWRAARGEACRATHVQHRQSEEMLVRRETCLVGQRDVLRGLLATIGRGDREVTSRAVELVLRLPRVEACDAPAPDAAAPERSAAIRAVLAELDVAIVAGRPADALPRARQALVDARALADAGIEAEVGLRLGRLELLASDAHATATLFDAALAAETSGRDELAVELWAKWLTSAALSEPSADEVAAAGRRAEAALSRAGSSPRLEAMLRFGQGSFAYEASDDQTAERRFREAVAAAEQAWGPDDWNVADPLDSLAGALAGQAYTAQSTGDPGGIAAGLLEEALALGQRALDLRTGAFGEHHPAVGRSFHNQGETLRQLGREDEAIAAYTRGLAIKEAALGPEHPSLGTSLVTLASADERAGRLDAALARFQQALVIWEHAWGKSSADLVSPIQGSADLLVALDRPAEAIELYRRCAALREGDPDRVRAYRRVAIAARLDSGDVAGAATEIADLVAEESDLFTRDDPRRARSLLLLARTELARGRAKDAAATLERVDRFVAANARVSDSVLAELGLVHAEVSAARGRAAEARTLAAAALAHCADDACGLDRYRFERRAVAYTARGGGLDR